MDLMGRVNLDIICIVGQWRSNMMLLYLHITENNCVEGLTILMLQCGYYALFLM